MRLRSRAVSGASRAHLGQPSRASRLHLGCISPSAWLFLHGTASENSTAEEKANTIALTLLADYMFFERDQGMISCVQDSSGEMVCKFTCCLTWCCGCILPCTGTCKPPKGEGGGGPVRAEGEWEPEDEWLRNYMRNVKMNRD